MKKKIQTIERNVVRSQRGFTIIEMLTASVILVIAFVALLTLLRAGRSMDIEGLHRRHARAIIDSCFESDALDYTNYANLDAQKIDEPGEPITNANLQPFDAHLLIILGPEATMQAVDGTPITYRDVTVKVKWLEAGKTEYSTIEVTKRISSF